MKDSRTQVEAAGACPSPQKSAAPSVSAMPVARAHDEIARRAYDIYVKKGRQPGQCQQNWQQAEQDLQHQGQATQAPQECGCGRAPAPHVGSAPAAASGQPSIQGVKGDVRGATPSPLPPGGRSKRA
jgi:hypothetical protein